MEPPREIVRVWRKRLFQKRLAGLEDLSHPGRKPISPPEIAVKIKALACESPMESGLPLFPALAARTCRPSRRAGNRRVHQRSDGVAADERGRDSSLAASNIDFPAGQAIPDEGGARPGPLPSRPHWRPRIAALSGAHYEGPGCAEGDTYSKQSWQRQRIVRIRHGWIVWHFEARNQFIDPYDLLLLYRTIGGYTGQNRPGASAMIRRA